MKIKSSARKEYIGLLYISPWIIGFLAFQLYPFVASFIYSFSSYSLLKAPRFIGLQNYIRMFKSDPLFIKSLLVTVNYVFLSVPAKIIFALFVAMLLNMKIRGVGVFRTVYYLPSIFGGSVAISILWKGLFMHTGVVNKFLGLFFIRPIDWLGDPKYSLTTISMLTVWQFGSSMILFLAGLKQIPNELYEAAKVDGSSKIHSFFKITLPMLSPIVFFNLVMQLINAFQDFTGAFVVTNGGPMNSTYVFGMLLYTNAFNYFKMGYASALSWILFIIILAFTAMIFRSSSYWTFYENEGDF